MTKEEEEEEEEEEAAAPVLTEADLVALLSRARSTKSLHAALLRLLDHAAASKTGSTSITTTTTRSNSSSPGLSRAASASAAAALRRLGAMHDTSLRGARALSTQQRLRLSGQRVASAAQAAEAHALRLRAAELTPLVHAAHASDARAAALSRDLAAARRLLSASARSLDEQQRDTRRAQAALAAERSAFAAERSASAAEVAALRAELEALREDARLAESGLLKRWAMAPRTADAAAQTPHRFRDAAGGTSRQGGWRPRSAHLPSRRRRHGAGDDARAAVEAGGRGVRADLGPSVGEVLARQAGVVRRDMARARRGEDRPRTAGPRLAPKRTGKRPATAGAMRGSRFVSRGLGLSKGAGWLVEDAELDRLERDE